MTERVRRPVLWTYGFSDCNYWPLLVELGLLDPGAGIGVPKVPRLPYALTVIMRATEPDHIRFPVELGFVGGQSFAVFPKSGEPDHIYEDWLHALEGGAEGIKRLIAAYTESDRFKTSLFARPLTAPHGAVAYLSPFGRENRHSAVAARAGWAPDALARKIAERCGLELQVSACSSDEFWETWDSVGEIRGKSCS